MAEVIKIACRLFVVCGNTASDWWSCSLRRYSVTHGFGIQTLMKMVRSVCPCFDRTLSTASVCISVYCASVQFFELCSVKNWNLLIYWILLNDCDVTLCQLWQNVWRFLPVFIVTRKRKDVLTVTVIGCYCAGWAPTRKLKDVIWGLNSLFSVCTLLCIFLADKYLVC